MSEQVKTETLEDQLEAKEFEIAQLEHSMGSDAKMLVQLQKEHRELCGEVGHDFDDGDTWVRCINCGEYNPNVDGEDDRD